MSATFTIPLSAADPFSHGHSHSQPRSHSRRPRGSARLAPPFPLPRIPSESLSQSQEPQHTYESNQDAHSHNHQYTHMLSPTRKSSLSPIPQYDVDGPLLAKKRSFDISAMVAPAAASHSHHGQQQHQHQHRNVSRPTKFLLHSTENYSLLHGILADHDSRRIFYFMILNLAFMVVQSTYGYLTGSLGLISDSIHMFFDCVALLVGVCAAVMSKWPPSVKFPYGYGKIDTLAGLGNGIFLILISVEICYEAIERVAEGAEVSRTTELLLVSSIGLVVNFVGIFAFHGHHGHHGHDHGHGHGHSHSHSHEQTGDCDHDHDHDHDHAQLHHKSSNASLLSNAAPPPKKKSAPHAHGHHDHGSENMQGIYLHIMADALGSVAVVVSTLLVKATGWSGFDPIASLLIGVLIFISTVPLLVSTTKILLLSLNSDVEYNLRDILSGVSDIRGVVGYTVPKFWLEDIKKEAGHGHHHHDHGSSTHSHSHSHDDHHHHHHHDSVDSDHSHADVEEATVLGVIHIIASQTVELIDVKDRVSKYFRGKQMDVVVQVEREGEGRCFCGGGLKTG